MTGSGLLPLARRWWWLILAAAVASALVAWAFASQEQKTYKADVKLLVGPVSGDLATVQASGALARTYAELAHSRRLVATAAGAAGVKLTSRQLDTAVSATSNDVTRIVDVEVRHSSPEAAAKLANAVAAQLRRLHTRPPSEGGDAVDAIMRDPEVAALPLDVRRTVRDAAIAAVGSPNVGSLQVVDAPVVPRHPVSPKVTLLVLLAAIAGALAACVYALVHEGIVNSRVDSFDDLGVDSIFRFANGSSQPHLIEERPVDDSGIERG
jgi:tyrosine-protein kinase